LFTARWSTFVSRTWFFWWIMPFASVAKLCFEPAWHFARLEEDAVGDDLQVEPYVDLGKDHLSHPPRSRAEVMLTGRLDDRAPLSAMPLAPHF
jgi:hypothetical protein